MVREIQFTSNAGPHCRYLDFDEDRRKGSNQERDERKKKAILPRGEMNKSGESLPK